MRQRSLTKTGDFGFGINQPWLVNSPATVAQAIMTRLKLATSEWFLDQSEGTPYHDQILGYNTFPTRDLAVRTRILDTPGVKEISEYVSFVDKTRAFSIVGTVNTLYGTTTFSATL